MWNVAAEWLGHVGDTVRIKTDAHFTSIFRSIYTSLCIGINTLVMRLALYLCSKKGPPGNIWRGKHKLLKEVTPKDRSNLLLDYAREEQNMFYLRHPYLTFEQSYGHAVALKKKEQWIDNFRKIRIKYKDHFTMEMQYSHLKVKDAWE